MTNGLDQGPRWGTVGPKPKDPPGPRPFWAVPALILGLIIGLSSASRLGEFVVKSLADPERRGVYSFSILFYVPFSVPLSAFLLIAGGLAAMRPLTGKRRRLRVVWVTIVLVLAVGAFAVPTIMAILQGDFDLN